jgi:hypothetical protein
MAFSPCLRYMAVGSEDKVRRTGDRDVVVVYHYNFMILLRLYSVTPTVDYEIYSHHVDPAADSELCFRDAI